MKKIFLLLLFVPFFALGQQQDAKAKKILDDVSANIKKLSSIKSEFDFSLNNKANDINETYQGVIWLKGNKYKVSLMGVDTYFNGETVWTHNIDSEEVNIDVPEEDDESSLNPAKIFTMYNKGFKQLFKKEENKNGKLNYVIDLFPIKQDKPYSRIRLWIDKKELMPSVIMQQGKDGNTYTIKIKKSEKNIEMPSSMFEFDTKANPDVDVIDMR